jgi:predicted adenylyl cyclase CyaB
MPHINIEIKARCTDQDRIREILKSENADCKGIDHQIDTYFKSPNGRLKLRQGTIENSLIFYNREDKEGPKQSEVTLLNVDPTNSPRDILVQAMGVLVEVDKEREIYFIENIKFHLDTVKGLGTFVEIEAIDSDGSIGKETLLEQCNEYLEKFGIQNDDLISVSYSDMLLEQGN